MCLKHVNIMIITGSNTNNLIKPISYSLLLEYQNNLLEKLRGNVFIFDFVDNTYDSCHKITLKRGGLLYIKSLDWLDSKKATINLKNRDEQCFKFVIFSFFVS